MAKEKTFEETGDRLEELISSVAGDDDTRRMTIRHYTKRLNKQLKGLAARLGVTPQVWQSPWLVSATIGTPDYFRSLRIVLDEQRGELRCVYVKQNTSDYGGEDDLRAPWCAPEYFLDDTLEALHTIQLELITFLNNRTTNG